MQNQQALSKEIVTLIVTPPVTKINTDGFTVGTDDLEDIETLKATDEQHIVENPNLDNKYEEESFEQVFDENTEPLTPEYEATSQIKTDASKTGKSRRSL